MGLHDPRIRPFLIYGGLFAAALLAGTLFFNPELSRSGDNAEYIVIAKSLARGDGLMYISDPDPVPSRKFPPLFPAILAVAEYLAPGNILVMKGIVLLLFSIAIPIVFRIIKVEHSPEVGWLVACTCILSPYLLTASHVVLSEIPLLTFSLSAIAVAQSGRRDWNTLLGIFLLSAAAYYTRTAALPLLGAIPLTYLLRRDIRTAFLLAAAMILLVLPWSIYTAQLGGGAYLKVLLKVNPYDPNSPMLSLGGLLARVLENLQSYLTVHIGQIVNPFLSGKPKEYGVLEVVGHSAVIVCGLAYFWSAMKRPVSVIPVYLLSYMAMLLFWPHVWTSGRFLLPVVPFIFYVFYAGGGFLLSLLPVGASARRTVAWTLAVLVLGANAASVQERQRPAEGWRDYYAAADWIQEHSPPDAIVACRKPFLMFLASGRRSLRYAFASPDELIRDLYSRGATLLILDGLGEFGSNVLYLYPAVEKHGEIFRELYRTTYARVLELHPIPAERYRQVALLHRQDGDSLTAKTAVDKLRDLELDTPRDQTILAQLLIDFDRLDEASVILENVVQFAQPVLDREEVGKEVLQLANMIYTQLLRVDPNNPRLLDEQAFIKMRMGRLKDAIQILRNVSQSHLGTPEYRRNLAGTLAMSGDFEAAASELDTLLEEHPGFQPGHVLRREIESMILSPPVSEAP